MNAVVKEVPKTEIAEFDEFAGKLAEFRKRYEGVVYDLTIPEQEKQARSDRYAIGKVISALDSKHKELKEPLKRQTDLIDGERKRIKDDLLSIQDKIKSQIEKREADIAAHALALQERVDAIRLLDISPDVILSAQNIQNRIDEVSKIQIDDTYEDRKADAALAMMETKNHLNMLLAARVKYEAEQAELDKLRKEKEARERAEREEQIRKVAEEKAKCEAQAQIEAAERAKKDAEERGRIAKEAAERREVELKAQAEKQAKVAAERAIQEECARAEKEAAEKAYQAGVTKAKEDAAKAKKSHVAKIDREVMESLDAVLLDEITVGKVFEAIRDGKITHVTLNY